jgi:subtilisin family serine protease
MIGRPRDQFGLVTTAARRSAVFGLLVCMGIGSIPPAVAAAAPPAEFRPGTLIVAYRTGTSAAERNAEQVLLGAGTLRTFRAGATLLSVPPGREVAVAKALRARGDVLYAEPDYLMTLAGVPNDPSFSEQWAAQNTGQTVNGITGTAGADEKAVAAWSVTTGTRLVVVAVVDGGVDYNHPDLAANIWTNPGGIGGCPAGSHGYNVVNRTCDPMDDLAPSSGYGSHGTRVAGVLGAVGGNGIGIAGVSWATTILPVKWVGATAYGSTSSLIDALDWVLVAKAAGVNVRVVNDSAVYVASAHPYSQSLHDEIALLGQNDILFVTPAGNTSENNDDPATPRYPCNYDLPNLVCVAASNQADALPSWANWGATTVDLAAPGANIYSTERNGTYWFQDGSSFAAPQVAGTAALILATGYMSATALKARILNNVDPLPSLAGKVLTGGRLDVCRAVPGCGNASFTLSGSVTAAGTGVVGAWVYAFDATTLAYATSTASGTGGAYAMALPPGSYKLYVQPRNGTNPDQWYGGATPTVVPVSANTPGVNIALAAGL